MWLGFAAKGNANNVSQSKDSSKVNLNAKCRVDVILGK